MSRQLAFTAVLALSATTDCSLRYIGSGSSSPQTGHYSCFYLHNSIKYKNFTPLHAVAKPSHLSRWVGCTGGHSQGAGLLQGWLTDTQAEVLGKTFEDRASLARRKYRATREMR